MGYLCKILWRQWQCKASEDSVIKKKVWVDVDERWSKDHSLFLQTVICS